MTPEGYITIPIWTVPAFLCIAVIYGGIMRIIGYKDGGRDEEIKHF